MCNPWIGTSIRFEDEEGIRLDVMDGLYRTYLAPIRFIIDAQI